MIKTGVKNKFPLFGAVLSAFLISAFVPQNTCNNQNDADDKFKFRELTNNAFTKGEKLKLRVHYGVINAAVIEVEVKDTLTIEGRKVFHIKAEGRTNKSFDWAYKVRDKFETYVDQDALCPLKYTKSVRENKYEDSDFVIFRHNKKKLNGIKGAMDMPVYTQDVISALFYARNIDFSKAKKGDIFPIDVYLDNKIYNLAFKYDGKETISSDVGKVKCIRLIPKLVVDRVFKGEDDMTVWISDDSNKIPIRVKSDIQVGSLKVDLTEYSGLKNSFSAKIK